MQREDFTSSNLTHFFNLSKRTRTKYHILDLLQKYNIPYAQKGKNYVCRCPWCKGDERLKDHNALINVDSSTIYCFSEQKTYLIRDLLLLFGEISERKLEKAREKLKKDAERNTRLARTTKKRRKFDDVKERLLSEGYTVTGIYEYRNLAGEKEYEVIRFEKPNPDGGKSEKILIPVTPDGYVGLGNKRQIPYRLEQFLLFQSDEIWLTEGEKCTDSVIASMPSDANIIVLGFRKVSDFKGFEDLFQGKKVVIFTDNDKTGLINTQNIVELLKNIAKEIIVVKFSEFPDGYDVADFLEDFSWEKLIERIKISEKIETPASQLSVIKTGTIEKVEKQEEWILEPLIPSNSIILFDGLGATGKFMPTGKYPILYLTAEETDWRFYERLQKIESAYFTSSKNFYWVSTLSKDFCLPTTRLFHKKQNEVQPTETFVFLENAIKKTQAKLIILDSWINFYGLDENSTEDGSVAYDYMKSLIRQYGCSILIIHHQTKEAMRGNANIFRGTMVFREQARARIVMSKKNGQKIIEIEKLNYPSELISKFPLSVELFNGVWKITGQQVVIEEEYKNGNSSEKHINTKWLQIPDDF
jgi:5S rRNA maturation endonuclease (ribonuclease M5)